MSSQTHLLDEDSRGQDHTNVEKPDSRDIAHDVDGRTLRRTRNREAVLDALISLIKAGDLEPTVGKIADLAGVSHRSIFRYFTDLDHLARSAIEAEFARVATMLRLPDVGAGEFEVRLQRIVDSQIAAQLEMHMLGRIAVSKAISIPEIDESFQAVNEFRIAQIRHHFGPELARRSFEEQAALATSIAMLMSFHSFDTQHRILGQSVDIVRMTWTTTIRTMFAR